MQLVVSCYTKMMKGGRKRRSPPPLILRDDITFLIQIYPYRLLQMKEFEDQGNKEKYEIKLMYVFNAKVPK